MMQQTQTNRIFDLKVDFKNPLQNKLFSLVKGPIEHVLAFPRLNRIYDDVSKQQDNRPFLDKVLGQLGAAYDLPDEDLARIMKANGPVIVVANHPFGGIETVILASILRKVRGDVKFMANYLLNAVPEIRDLLITVNPFKGKTSVRDNIKPIRDCIQWVQGGGMLVVFPSGAVSHFVAQKGTVTDPEWSLSIARIIRKTGAPVLPVFFGGTNSAAFHMAGMVHPLLRTAMLPNELLNKGQKKIKMRVGDLIPFRRLNSFEQDAEVTAYLRLRTYILEHRGALQKAPGIAMFVQKVKREAWAEVMPPRIREIMAEEIRQLPPSQILHENGEQLVLQATADQIPHILLEIGRLREITFRAVGEGTGKAVDLDRFDHTYIHLFIWNREKKQVVGSYRLGRTDELMKKQGLRGLYTSTLFRYEPALFARLGPALEMGRSFIRPEYQKSFAPLLLLWKGIGRFVVDNPQYKTLFGPVSITDEYHVFSKQLMVGYLKKARYQDDMAGFVKARKPIQAKSLKGWDIDAVASLLKDDVEDLSELVSCVERDGKGVPVLLKQYLKLGGMIAGFNVDPAFGNVLDGLIIVDLTKTEPRMRERYLGRDGSRQFLAYYEARDRERNATCA
jgi:putative hemolysin